MLPNSLFYICGFLRPVLTIINHNHLGTLALILFTYSAMSARKLHLISYEVAGSAGKVVRLCTHGDDTGNGGLNSRLNIRQTWSVEFFTLEEAMDVLK